jgi:hypothetical protein
MRPIVRIAISVMGSALLFGCNGLLGIGPASLETENAPDATVPADAGVPLYDAGPPMVACNYYCATIMNNCTGSNAEYLSFDICMNMCPNIDLSTSIADTADDTLGCRIFAAQAASSTPDTSCHRAGPLGGGHCGASICNAFCNQDLNYCNASEQIAYPGGAVECTADCARYTYLTTDAGDLTTESGDSLNCRLWHLETANTSVPYGKIHCEHTAKVSMTCYALDAGGAPADGGHD